jgi:Toastrack DUF4097
MFRAARLAAAIAVVASLSAVSTAMAQPQRSMSNDDWCRNGSGGRRAWFCEVRESTLPGVNPLDIDAGQNGGIHIRGWDRADVLVRARVEAHANTDAEARALASAVRVDATGTTVRAEGPSMRESDRDGQSWSVSFDIQVPRTAMLTLHTVNGGIAIDDFHGTAQFRASNGGVSLSNVGGDIKGQTTNGGVSVNLAGDRWDGAGLDVETHNGGVRLSMPDNYSAVLDTGTVNGRIHIDFPITVQGRSDHITTTLGSGGAKVRAVTTNGGVTIQKR